MAHRKRSLAGSLSSLASLSIPGVWSSTRSLPGSWGKRPRFLHQIPTCVGTILPVIYLPDTFYLKRHVESTAVFQWSESRNMVFPRYSAHYSDQIKLNHDRTRLTSTHCKRQTPYVQTGAGWWGVERLGETSQQVAHLKRDVPKSELPASPGP